jgi:hypothetical protein
MLGAPNLTDKIWLFGGSAETVMETIRKGRTATMPAFGEFLGDAKVHVLSAYVWSLSNDAGKLAQPAPAAMPTAAATATAPSERAMNAPGKSSRCMPRARKSIRARSRAATPACAGCLSG